MKKIPNLLILLITILTILIVISSSSCSNKITKPVEIITCVPEFPLIVIGIFPDKDFEMATYKTISFDDKIFYFKDQLGKFCQGDRITVEYVDRSVRSFKFD